MTVCVSTDPMRKPAPHLKLVPERAAAPVLRAPSIPLSTSPDAAVASLYTEAERDALFVELQPLIDRLIRQYGEDVEQREDLRGELYRSFCDLLAGYDPARGVPLRPYLTRDLALAAYTFAGVALTTAANPCQMRSNGVLSRQAPYPPAGRQRRQYRAATAAGAV